MQNTKIEQMQQQNISTSLCGKGSEIGTQTIGALEPSNEHDYFEYYLIHLIKHKYIVKKLFYTTKALA